MKARMRWRRESSYYRGRRIFSEGRRRGRMASQSHFDVLCNSLALLQHTSVDIRLSETICSAIAARSATFVFGGAWHRGYCRLPAQRFCRSDLTNMISFCFVHFASSFLLRAAVIANEQTVPDAEITEVNAEAVGRTQSADDVIRFSFTAFSRQFVLILIPARNTTANSGGSANGDEAATSGRNEDNDFEDIHFYSSTGGGPILASLYTRGNLQNWTGFFTERGDWYSVAPAGKQWILVERLNMTDAGDNSYESAPAPLERPRRQSNYIIPNAINVTVKVMVLIELGVYNTFCEKFSGNCSLGLKEIKLYYKNSFNAVNLMFSSLLLKSLAIKIELVDVRYVRFTNESDVEVSLFENIINRTFPDRPHISSGDALWLVGRGHQKWLKPHITAYDHAMVITSLDLCSSQGCGAVGIAYLEGVCTSHQVRVSIVEERRKPYSSLRTIAHELAHNLGADHDSSSGECVSAGGYIMSSVEHSTYPRHAWSFSCCSQQAMFSYLRAHGGCLRRNTAGVQLEPLLGVTYGRDAQCKFRRGSWSGTCDPAPAGRRQKANQSSSETEYAIRFGCMSMWCKGKSGTCTNSTSRYVFPGTSCAPDDSRWCIDGRCVRREFFRIRSNSSTCEEPFTNVTGATDILATRQGGRTNPVRGKTQDPDFRTTSATTDVTTLLGDRVATGVLALGASSLLVAATFVIRWRKCHFGFPAVAAGPGLTAESATAHSGRSASAPLAWPLPPESERCFATSGTSNAKPRYYGGLTVR